MSTGTTPSASSSPKSMPREDREYDPFRDRIQARFLANLAEHGGRLFTTDADPDLLWAAYLGHLPDRPYHDCNACRRFIATFGGLVTIDASGRIASAFWHADDVPGHYAEAIEAMASIVHRARVTGVFLSSETTWGTPSNVAKATGQTWTHHAVTPPAAVVHKHALLSAHQAMAEKKEDFGIISRALQEFSGPALDQVMTLLESEALYRSEKVIDPARWLRDLHVARTGVQHARTRDNLTWRAIASAPAGFCHPRSSMIGTILDDIASGMDFATVSRRFAAKMHPLQYQRPTAAPSAGNIAAAEKIVEKLGIARSLPRRFARLDEVQAIWKPRQSKAEAPANGGPGVFGHLKPKGAGPSPSPIVPPPMTMTWEKFLRTVLPTADAIEFYAAPKADSYAAIVTAVNADAPAILQWDREDRRNPFSWYLYSSGSIPGQWGLKAGDWHKVNAVTSCPAHWGIEPGSSAFSHQNPGALFIIDGAKDGRYESGGGALFPEIMKSELREVRSVIEAYSRSAVLGGSDEASACGILLGKGGSWDARFRATTGRTTLEYRLDRWD